MEGYKRKAFLGLALPRSDLTGKAVKGEGRCDACERSRPRRQIKGDSTDVLPTVAGSKLYMDIAVYENCPSMEGYQYCWCMPMTCKSDALGVIRSWFASCIKPYSISIHSVHSDQGAELISEDVRAFFREEVHRTQTWNPTDTPEMNGLVEQLNGELNRMTLASLLHSGRDPAFWWLAYEAARHVYLRLPTKTAQGWMTPYEALRKVPPVVSHIRTFGCRAWVVNTKVHKDFGEKAVKGIFVGYSKNQKDGRSMYLHWKRSWLVSLFSLMKRYPHGRRITTSLWLP